MRKHKIVPGKLGASSCVRTVRVASKCLSPQSCLCTLNYDSCFRVQCRGPRSVVIEPLHPSAPTARGLLVPGALPWCLRCPACVLRWPRQQTRSLLRHRRGQNTHCGTRWGGLARALLPSCSRPLRADLRQKERFSTRRGSRHTHPQHHASLGAALANVQNVACDVC